MRIRSGTLRTLPFFLSFFCCELVAPREASAAYREVRVSKGARLVGRVRGRSGPLGGALVFIDRIRSGKAWPEGWERRELRLRGGPVERPVILRAGGTLRFVNAAARILNVKISALKNPSMNTGIAVGGALDRRFAKPEGPLPFSCSCDPGMRGVLFVAGHPYYAISDEAGRFALEDIPAGSFRLRVWHPGGLGESRSGRTSKFTLGAASELALDLRLSSDGVTAVARGARGSEPSVSTPEASAAAPAPEPVSAPAVSAEVDPESKPLEAGAEVTKIGALFGVLGLLLGLGGFLIQAFRLASRPAADE